MSSLTDQVSSFFRQVAIYHDIPRQPLPVTIVSSHSSSFSGFHGSSSRVERKKSTEENTWSIAIDILQALVLAAGVAQFLPEILRPLNYSRHVEAVEMTQPFLDTPFPNDPIGNEIVKRHAKIATENCGKAKKLLASALLFTAASVARLTLKSNKYLSPKNMNVAIGLSLGFGALSHCYHTLRTPTLHQYHPEINAKGWPSGERPGEG